MLSTRRLPSENLKTSEEIRISPADRNSFVPQILGNEEEFIAPSMRKLAELEPWGVDINMGCPVTHTLRHNWGFRLVGQPDYAAQVVAMTKRHANCPVSVKLRGDAAAFSVGGESLDEEQSSIVLTDFVRRLVDAGADWITIHPRPGRLKHRGPANWALVAAIRNNLQIPVVANGDIQTAEDALAVTNGLGCDGAMFARAVCARPWVLWQTARALGCDGQPAQITHRTLPPVIGDDEGHEYIHAVLKLIEILSSYTSNERYICDRVQFFCATGSKWYQFGHDFWRVTTKAQGVDDLRQRVAAYGERYVNPSYARVSFI
jgi:tRNA-dihydrouridine synthase